MLTPAQSFSVIRQIEQIGAFPRKRGDAARTLADTLPTIFEAPVFDPTAQDAPHHVRFTWMAFEEAPAILVGLLRGSNMEEAWIMTQDESGTAHIHFAERGSGVYHMNLKNPNTFAVQLNQKTSFDENRFDIIDSGAQNGTDSVSRLLRGACDVTSVVSPERPLQMLPLEFLVTEAGGIVSQIGHTFTFAGNAETARGAQMAHRKRLAQYNL